MRAAVLMAAVQLPDAHAAMCKPTAMLLLNQQVAAKLKQPAPQPAAALHQPLGNEGATAG
jgi:hypothetical protein